MEEKEIVYWDMCPYCDEEVELYTLGLQQCPNCGLHFEPDPAAYIEAINNQ
jgi:predicted amidophosphoribosyltransferase